jgi:hypothetical protein
MPPDPNFEQSLPTRTQINIQANLASAELDESAEAFRDHLHRSLPGVQVGILHGQGLSGLPESYEMELVGVVADIEPANGWIRFVGPADSGEPLELTVFRARVYLTGVPAFAEAKCPGPFVSIKHLERLNRLSDAQRVLRGAIALQNWAKGRTPGSGVLDKETFTSQLNDALSRLGTGRTRISCQWPS